MTESAYAVRGFEEFWPHYVRMHARPETQACHAVGSLACLGFLVASAVTRQPGLALLGPLADYLISQASHRLFEANRTTPWRSPLWHSRAELRMLGLVLRGRMRAEVEAFS